MSSPDEAGVFHAADLDMMRTGDADDDAFIMEMVASFRPRAWVAVASVRSALEASEIPRLRDAAHKLKGMSAMMGLRRLAKACEATQKAAGQGRGGLTDLVARIEREASRGDRALGQFLGETDR